MTTIAIVTDVQTAGSLLGESSGGPKTAQIESALNLAQTTMVGLVSVAAYIATRDYAGADADELAKQAAFKLGEARFALSHLPRILRSAQMTEKGYVSESEIGKAITRYGEIQGSLTYEEDWHTQAMLAIAEHIDLEFEDPDTEEQIGMTTGDGSITMMTI